MDPKQRFINCIETLIDPDQLEMNKADMSYLISQLDEKQFSPHEMLRVLFTKIEKSGARTTWNILKLISIVQKKFPNILTKENIKILEKISIEKKYPKLDNVIESIIALGKTFTDETEGDSYKRQMLAIKNLQKEKHDIYRKEHNIVFADEVDVCNQENKKHKNLPKELRKNKESRVALNVQLEEIRQGKAEQDTSKACCNRCSRGCFECKYYQNARQKQANEMIIQHRLPLELRKIKESKRKMKEDIPKIREEKKQEYYNRGKNNDLSLSIANQMPQNISESDESEQLRSALELSMLHNQGLDSNYDSDDDLRTAIDLSMNEQSSMISDSQSEELMVKLALELSLEEKSFNDLNDEVCIICFSKDSVWSFQPCYHKCLCNSCYYNWIEKNLTQCPICRKNFSNIIFSKV